MAEAQRTRFDEIADGYRNEGIALGRSEWRCHFLRCVVAKRFDAETTERFMGHFDPKTTERFMEYLEFISDTDRLVELVEAIVKCETAEELLSLMHPT